MVAPLDIAPRPLAPFQYLDADADTESVDGEILNGDELEDASMEEAFSLVMPDGIDQEEVLSELWADLLRGEKAKAVLAEAEMARVIEFNRSLEHRTVDGLGQITCRVPMSTYLHWTTRYGPEFWRHRDSLDFFAARNPGFLIDTFHRRTCVTVDQTLPASGAETPASLVKTAGATVTTDTAAPAQPAPSSRRGGRGRWAR